MTRAHGARLTGLASSPTGRNQAMHNRTSRTVAAAVVGAALIAAGCSNSAAQPTPAATTPTAAAATTTAPTPSGTAIAQGMQAITAYYTVYNRLGRDPNGDLAAITTVTSGQATTAVTSEIQNGKAQGVHDTGDITIARAKATDVSINKSIAEIRAEVCYDVSKVKAVDGQGKPLPTDKMQAAGNQGNNVVTVPWLDQRAATFTVTNPAWPDATAWRVSKIDTRNQPCT